MNIFLVGLGDVISVNALRAERRAVVAVERGILTFFACFYRIL